MNTRGIYKFTFISLAILSQLFSGCASYKPGSVQYRPASSSPEAVLKQDVSVVIKPLSVSSAKSAYDYDFTKAPFKPIMVAVSNRSDQNIRVEPSNSEGYVSTEDAFEHTKFSAGARMTAWSAPWVIGWAATGIPIAGILWPIIGLVDVSNVDTLNTEKRDFIETNSFASIVLQPGKETQGIIFVEKSKINNFSLSINSGNDNQLVFRNSNYSEAVNNLNKDLIVSQEFE